MQNKDYFMYGLGALIVIGFFVILGLLILIEMPASNEKMLYMVIGVLMAKFGEVVSYFYGSSKGSADKNDIINKP